MVSLIVNIEAFDPDFEIIAASSYLIIVPRFLSAIMMHLNVEPDIRSGIKLMKYTVNNPHCFKGVRQEDGSMNYRNAIAPFLLGFFQTTVSIIVEIMLVVYLSSLGNLMAIIMRYVSMASIVKYDDMYAKSLFESKAKNAKGKTLHSYFDRGSEGNHISKSYLMKFLRFVQKCFRV